MRRLATWCICALFLVPFSATSALADKGIAIVGVYGDLTGKYDAMAVTTATDPKNKAAVFAWDVHSLSQPTVRLLVFFDAKGWQQFEQIWLKARRTAPPRDGARIPTIGEYFDSIGNTQVSADVERDGSIQLTIIGKPKGKLTIGSIPIRSKDLQRFDQDVKKVADYFKN